MKNVIKGLGTSPGIIQGTVTVIRSDQDAKKRFNQNDVLVTKMTDPTMVHLMARAGAIICDIGGIGSHASIVARELGIPCIVNTKTGTQVLRDGMRVHVDGSRGTVTILSR